MQRDDHAEKRIKKSKIRIFLRVVRGINPQII